MGLQRGRLGIRHRLGVDVFLRLDQGRGGPSLVSLNLELKAGIDG
jgi:hypothetical protein